MPLSHNIATCKMKDFLALCHSRTVLSECDLLFLLHPHLYASLCQVCPECQLLTGIYIWVVCLLENFLQLLQLVAGECSAIAPLLAFVALSLAFFQGAGEVGPRALALPLHTSFL